MNKIVLAACMLTVGIPGLYSTYRRSSSVTFVFFWPVPALGKPVGS